MEKCFKQMYAQHQSHEETSGSKWNMVMEKCFKQMYAQHQSHENRCPKMKCMDVPLI